MNNRPDTLDLDSLERLVLLAAHAAAASAAATTTLLLVGVLCGSGRCPSSTGFALLVGVGVLTALGHVSKKSYKGHAMGELTDANVTMSTSVVGDRGQP